MTVTQSTPVSREGFPLAISAVGSTPAVPLVERCWEPQRLFIHDWSQPVTLLNKWQTVVSKSRTGVTQRNGLSEKPMLSLASTAKCFESSHWGNLGEMFSKQEVCRYLAPLHCDPIHGVTLFDPQNHRFSVQSDLSTRRLFQGQNAMIATVERSAMWDEFTCAEVVDVNSTTRRITLETPLRRAQYQQPTIRKSIRAVTGTGTPPAGGWGYASGSSVVMWAGKSWAAGTSTTVGGNDAVTGVATVINSKARAVLVKPNDQIVSIAYTMCRNSQTMSLAPTRIRAVQGKSGQVNQVTPTWTLVPIDGQTTWTESGVVGGSTTNQPTNFSHQRIGATTPTAAQVRTCIIQIRTTTVTQAMFDTLINSDTGITGDGEAQVFVDAAVTGSAGTGTTSDNALMHAVLVIRDGFLQAAGGTASLVKGASGLMMTHISQDAPSQSGSDYPLGVAFPNLSQTVSVPSYAPKPLMVALQLMSYGLTTQPDPLMVQDAGYSLTSLYPTTEVYPDGTSTPANTNLSRAFSTTNDVVLRLYEMTENDVQEEPVQNVQRNFGWVGKFDATTATPSSVFITPFLFNLGLLLNPSIQKPLRCYPLVEADASPPMQQFASPQNSLVGSATMTATQTSGKPALDAPDSMVAAGWDTSVYPAFQSNPKSVFFGANTCNINGEYPTTNITAPLLTGKFDYAGGINIGASSSVETEQIGIGRSVEGYLENPRKEFSVSATFLKRTDAFKFLQLWNNRRGRLLPVWFPNPSNAIVGVGSAIDNEVYLLATEPMSVDHGGKFLYVKSISGVSYILSVSSYAPSNGFTTVTIDTTLNPDGTQTCGLSAAARAILFSASTSLSRITTAHLCFFDSDELTETWKTDECMSVSFKLIEHPKFVPDETIGITTPVTGCGTCCGGVDPCPCIGGAAYGCPITEARPEACCICRTSDLRLRLTIFCYDNCFIVDQPNNDPFGDCPFCSCANCDATGSWCLPSGASEFEIEPLPAGTGGYSCHQLAFILPTPADASCVGSNNVSAILDMRTGEWTVDTGWASNPCCKGAACACIPPGCVCSSVLCPSSCGTPSLVDECLKFERYEAICNQTCAQAPNCNNIYCGDGTDTLRDCCGGEDPARPRNSKGRIKALGELFNDWGSVGSTTGCSLVACPSCV
jgi:hypothetical protein